MSRPACCFDLARESIISDVCREALPFKSVQWDELVQTPHWSSYMWQQFCKVERCRLSASLGLFVRDTKGLSMVAGEWRALTLASEGWPGLVSPSSQRAALQSWTTESRQFTFSPKQSWMRNPAPTSFSFSYSMKISYRTC